MDKQIVKVDRNEAEAFALTFLTPFYDQGRGNSTTAKRIVTGLKLKHQIRTNVVAYDEQSFTADLVVQMEKSQLLHVLHFRRFAEWLEKNKVDIKIPYLVTSGGTDVNIDIFLPEYKEQIGNVLKNAAAITVYSEDAKQKLIDVYGNLNEKIFIIKQSVWFPQLTDDDSNKILKLSETGPKIVLPAGLREVKDVLFVLPALIKLKEHFPALTFTIVGASIEGSVLKEVKRAIEKYSWITYYEEIPLAQMISIYEQSDIVINSSFSEGQSLALLEAMLIGKPVLARNNGGNRSIVRHRETGFLFDDVDQVYDQLNELLSNCSLYQQIASQGREYVRGNHTLEEEVNTYMRLYEQISLR
ncbi:glycosyltransferase [Bacillaceae bacterium IKA-2]|nr:glycosyltransferase [Bacillaceae bacterium IKA-2]